MKHTFEAKASLHILVIPLWIEVQGTNGFLVRICDLWMVVEYKSSHHWKAHTAIRQEVQNRGRHQDLRLVDKKKPTLNK